MADKLKENSYLLLLTSVGIAIGCLWSISSGALFLLALGIICAVILWWFSNAEDRKFIMTIFIFGIISRIAVYSVLGFISILAGRNGWLEPVADCWGTYNYAWAWAQQIHDPSKIFCLQEAISGRIYTKPYYLEDKVWQYGFNGFTYLLGTIYYFFGPLKFSPRLLNCLMGVGLGIFIYYIGKEIFGKRCARLSSILTVFIPSLFLWSLVLLKEIPFIFVGCVMLWSFTRFQKTNRIIFLCILFLAILVQGTIRTVFPTAFIMAVFILSYFIISEISWKKKIAISLCILILMCPFVQRIDFRRAINDQMVEVLNYGRGIINTGGLTYKIFADKYYSGGSMNQSNYISAIDFTKGFFKGWFYFLLVPFPWKTSTGLQLVSYAQVILWYLFIPFIVIGMVVSLRYKWKESFVIFAYIITIGSAIVLHSGNIGTVFRHRDILTPLFLIFASLGLLKTFGQLDNFNSNDERYNCQKSS